MSFRDLSKFLHLSAQEQITFLPPQFVHKNKMLSNDSFTNLFFSALCRCMMPFASFSSCREYSASASPRFRKKSSTSWNRVENFRHARTLLLSWLLRTTSSHLRKKNQWSQTLHTDVIRLTGAPGQVISKQPKTATRRARANETNDVGWRKNPG